MAKYIKREIVVFDDEKGLDSFAVRKWEETCSRAIGAKGSFAAALSGGRTPEGFYQRLSELKNTLFWDKIYLFLVDERLVPFENDDSNYGRIKKILLDKLNMLRGHVYSISTDEANSKTAAETYGQKLKEFFKLKDYELPRFDLIMLGIGEDGHTASLFPELEFSNSDKELVVTANVRRVKHERITLSLPVINHGHDIIFMAKGEDKADIVKEVIENKDSKVPAALVRPDSGRVSFLLDKAAASKLSKKQRR